MKKANIYDVANLAGVSHQTVSRVLNNHSSLKPETREKVEKAIAELNYRPNQAARQLVTSRSKIIGILIAGTELYGPWAILNAMEREARIEGYSVISISVLPDSPESWRAAIEQLRNLDIDGVITIALPNVIIKEVEKNLASATIVFVDTEPSKKFDAINIDNYQGGKIATQHLIDLGHKEIVHITGPISGYEGKMRLQAYEDVMKAAKLKSDVIEADWSLEKGYEVGKVIAARKKRPSAIFTANDHLAVGVLKALSEAGISVPENMSLIGFDDIPEAKFMTPSLTSIQQNFDELGKLSIHKMMAQLREPSKAESLKIDATLVIRDSTQKFKGTKGK
jgi:DNA-binding LacI/PurR family transcriptional regulator